MKKNKKEVRNSFVVISAVTLCAVAVAVDRVSLRATYRTSTQTLGKIKNVSSNKVHSNGRYDIIRFVF